MAYQRVTWEDGQTALSAEHMNNIEDGIEESLAAVSDLNNNTYTKSEVYTKTEADNKYRTKADSYAKSESFTLGTVVSKNFTTTDQTYTLTSDAYVYFGGTSTSRVEVLQVNCLINGTIVARQSAFLDNLTTDAPVYSSILLKKGTQIKYKKIILIDYTGATDSVSLTICPVS